MSLLTPLYIAGLLGISLPILFHLIRRSPSGQVPFSSLMFLSPSPPRLTRRSRIDHWLLLLLRAMALLLLVLAFSRPFLRQSTNFAIGGSKGRRIAILVDTSASMQRPGVWKQVSTKVDQLLKELTPADRTALYGFDRQVTEIVGFDHSLRPNQQQRHALIRNQLKSLTPSWLNTELGLALSTIATELETLADQDEIHVDATLQIVLVSDFQQGATLDQLDSFEWPKNVKLQVSPIECPQTTNASLHLVADRTQTDQTDADWRLRIDNASESASETYHIQWANHEGPITNFPPRSIYVLPGTSHVMRVPERKAATWDRLILSGDNQPFDNTLFMAPRLQETFEVAFIGQGSQQDPDDLLYYLKNVFTGDPLRTINVVQMAQTRELNLPRNISIKLVVASGVLDEETASSLRKYVSRGGHLLYIIKDETDQPSLQQLLQDKQIQLQEADVANYAMLSEINFAHPIFSSFASPQFRDFKSIHFWRYRKSNLTNSTNRRVLARFDSNDPAVIEEDVDDGKIWIMTSGWQPADSQLARSKKFLPLMVGILERSLGILAGVPQYHVGEEVDCLSLTQQPKSMTIINPQQDEFKLANNITIFDQTMFPGIYRWKTDRNNGFFAVNLAPAESQTAPLDPTSLEQHGIQIGRQLSSDEEQERDRQMRDRELESRQKFWQWLIAAAVVMVLGETWLSGRLARNLRSEPKETT